MTVAGLQKLTLLDFPGKTACTVFTPGCNFRCPFCHNARLVRQEERETLDTEAVFSFLRKRQGVLDGVCITGGEPLLQPDLPAFIEQIRALGLKVKLDTNGMLTERLRELLEKNLLDYVAMDIKNSPEKYGETVGIPSLDLTPINGSVDLLMQGTVPFEFRTTVAHPFHTAADFDAVGRWIAGAPRYFLQGYVDSGDILGTDVTPCSKAEMEQCLAAVRPYVPAAQIRGVD